jgi:hypothetical protein
VILMRQLLTPWLAVLVLMTGWPCSAARPDRVAVQYLFARLDRAMPDRDLDALRGFLADDVVIEVDATVRGEERHDTFSKPQYLEMVARAWRMASDYRYRRSNQRISAQGAKSIVTADTWESLTLDGMVMITRTRETMTIERTPDGLRATRIHLISSD